MEFGAFASRNHERCVSKDGFNHKLDAWSMSDWLIAIIGELGEAANIVKKLNRDRDGIPGNVKTRDELMQDLYDEVADTFIYLDLFAQSLGTTLEQIVKPKWNKSSRKIGYFDIIE